MTPEAHANLRPKRCAGGGLARRLARCLALRAGKVPAYAAGMIPVPLPQLPELLAEAEARLRRRRAYARPLSGRPAKVRHLEAALTAARAVLGAAARPAALWLSVSARAEGAMVTLDGLRLTAPRLAAEITAGGQPLLWLCTLGEDQARLGASAEGDYLRAHVTADLAQAALYAAARAVHAELAARHPAARLVRVSLREAEGPRWSPGAVARLLPLFGPDPLGVRQTDGGSFLPVHTLLGVVVAHPDGGAA